MKVSTKFKVDTIICCLVIALLLLIRYVTNSTGHGQLGFMLPAVASSSRSSIYTCNAAVHSVFFRSFMNNEILCLLDPFAVVQQYSAQLGVTR